MDILNRSQLPALENRIRRSQGREARQAVISAKLTHAEQKTILEAAKSTGKAPGEWARDVLLHAARNNGTDPLFTEIVGLRMLFVHLFEPLLTGVQLTPDSVNTIMKTVREDKHNIALEVMQQYTAKNVQEQ
jgi:hypothetical protein